MEEDSPSYLLFEDALHYFLLEKRQVRAGFKTLTDQNRLKKVNLAEKFGLFNSYWSPKVAGELNDAYVKLVKVKGEFVWHRHENEDELFLVAKGVLTIKLRNGVIHLKEGEFFVVPKGVEHKPVARREAHVVLIEPKTTLNTGNVRNDRTVRVLDWV